MTTATVFNLVGLALTFTGAGLGAFSVWVTPDQAIALGVTRWATTNKKENLKLPIVQNLLRQSKLTVTGFVLIGAGTVAQAIGVLL